MEVDVFFRYTRIVVKTTTIEAGISPLLLYVLGGLWLIGAVGPMVVTAVSTLLTIVMTVALVLAVLVTAGVSVAMVVALVHQVRSGRLALDWDRQHHPERFIVEDIERQRHELLAQRYAPTQFQVGAQGQIESQRVDNSR